ncbi:helix-turn-helix domain-containing protein [Paenibacillus antri]|uniref:Helix-turn-helix domain-containing protein n=1 Tax=Paenibacillus antri TaxID=2582848 RepID=A0A5R9GD60_9BACL|nr:AraC family transcriptional regulator [Paenibacillus antri]TLS51308.1 helix-turn-helix domain-containing protein [Paenibacillus antri]
MLSYLDTTLVRVPESGRVDVAGDEAPRFGFVQREHVSATMEDEAADFAAASGDWFFVPSRRRLTLYNPGPAPADVLLVRFRASEAVPAWPANEGGSRTFRLPRSRAPAEAFAASAGAGRFEALPLETRLERQAHLHAVAAACVAAARAAALSAEDPLHRHVEEARRAIRDRFDEHLDMEELARLSGASPSRFYQAFREHTGFSPHKLLTAVRLNASLARLSNAPASIMAVAHSVGYADELYFSRLFKKHMGVSPSEYASRANRRIANLCPVFEGDLAALGIASAFAPPRGWEARAEELLPNLRAAKPDIIFTHPVPDDIQAELEMIAPVERIVWKGPEAPSWKERLVRIASSLELPGVAERWLSLFETKASNARTHVNEKLGGAPFLLVGAYAGGFRVFGPQRKKMSDLFYSELGFAPPPEALGLGFLDTERIEDVAALPCDNVLFLLPDSLPVSFGFRLAAEWRERKSGRTACLLIRHSDPSLYNAAFYESLLDQTVNQLLRGDVLKSPYEK